MTGIFDIIVCILMIPVLFVIMNQNNFSFVHFLEWVFEKGILIIYLAKLVQIYIHNFRTHFTFFFKPPKNFGAF